jgi:hypothetical protein
MIKGSLGFAIVRGLGVSTVLGFAFTANPSEAESTPARFTILNGR